ncbi:protein phosphatase 1 regulatory subunit 3B isoform X1 [Pseudopipra pipra]|uniref:protein phosphatase 1 regulatory subunit 3B isoform X1 n=2 Tax=Pseudopipra pipra TaxID=415032 RepID=UPI0031398C52
MHCTRVLDYFPHKQAMAVDVAMQLYLCSSPLRREKCACKTAPKPSKPLRPCIQLSSKAALNGPEEATSSFTHNKVKKRVSFADSRGFALTMVKVFSEFDDPLDIPFNITELIDNIVGLTTAEKDSFVLDFVQPSVDYLAFRNRLETDCVCLENCVLKERSVVGTVKVKNLAFEKTVKIRMTFDTWKSFVDYPCQYVKDTYGGSDRDTFSFDINLPEGIQSHERVEFAISFECNGKMYWDNNRGTNYRITWSTLKSAQEAIPPPQGPDFGCAFDRFGSPQCSYGLFPEWPSYSGFEKLGPYY